MSTELGRSAWLCHLLEIREEKEGSIECCMSQCLLLDKFVAHQVFLVYLKMTISPQAHHWWSEMPRTVFGWRLQAEQEWVRSCFWCSCDFNSRAVLMLKVVPDPSALLTYPRTSALGNKVLIFQCKGRRSTVNFICHVFSSAKERGFVSLNLDGRTNQCLENQAGEMPRWWRARFAPAVNTDLAPSIHM